MFSARNIGVFVVGSLAVYLAFDVYLATDSVLYNTFSEQIRLASEHYEWIAYATALFLGALISHWFAKGGRLGESLREGIPEGEVLRAKLYRGVVLLALMFLGFLAALYW